MLDEITQQNASKFALFYMYITKTQSYVISIFNFEDIGKVDYSFDGTFHQALISYFWRVYCWSL